MRTEPSFSEKSEDVESVDTRDHQEELNIPDESDSPAEFADEPPYLADYRRRYGVSRDPFADDQHFPLYSGGQRRQILDQLLHVCQFSNNLMVVLGGYSVGKTRMAQALIDSLDDADDICFLEAQITSTFESLMEGVLTQLELPDIETFNEFVRRHTDSDGLAVLIIDNAHHLPDQVLLQLTELISLGQETRVHLVLFAEPHLLPRLQGLNVEDLLISDFQLIKFSLAETVDYLNFRMEMADYLGPELFTEANVETWWRQSRGQLLELHQYAQDKLLTSASASTAAPAARRASYGKKNLPVPHLVGAAALGAVLIMGLVYLGGDSAPKEAEKLTSIPIPQNPEQPAALPQPASAAAVAPVAQASAPVAGAVANEAVNVAVNVAPAAGVSAAPSSVASAAIPESTPVAEQPLKTAPAAVAATSVANPTAAVRSAVPETQVVKQSVVPLVQANGLAAGAKTTPPAAPKENKDLKKVDEAKKLEASAEKAVAKKAESLPADKPKVSGDTGGYSEQEKALLSWSESDFTLQLVGLSTEKAVRDFIAQQPNRKDLLLFKSVRQGKDWFVVVAGRYPSSAKARQAVASLPESQKAATPWPRDLKTIQREIRQR